MTHPDTAADNPRVLLIKAKGGLGNRMLSAVTGLIIADVTGRTPVIDWRDGTYAPPGENAYPLLFDTPLTGNPADYEGETSVEPAIWQGRLELEPAELIFRTTPEKLASPTIYRKSCIDMANPHSDAKLAVYWSYLPKFGRIAGLLRRDSRFKGRSHDDILCDYLAKYFRPNARVQTEVAQFMNNLPRPVLGVHVRYTDRKLPLDKIIAQVQARQQALPGSCIFLATDSAFVQDEMARVFGKVHFTPKYLPSDGTLLHVHGAQGNVDKQFEAENAMIDMWALARCDHLIYSKNSTFSLASALIGGLRRDQQDDIDARNLKIVVKRILQPYI